LRDWRRTPETGTKWTQEKLTDLQFLVEADGFCKIQLQCSAGNTTTLQADLSKRGFMLPIPEFQRSPRPIKVHGSSLGRGSGDTLRSQLFLFFCLPSILTALRRSYPQISVVEVSIMRTPMVRILFFWAALCISAASRAADDLVTLLAPTGTLRAVFIASNPVQAITDVATGEVRGPAAALTAELARQAGVPYTLVGVAGVQAVIDSVLNETADIGFLAFDAARAQVVEFSRPYVLGQNSYIVAAESRIQTIQDADRNGFRIGVNKGDAGDTFLTGTLQAATLVRTEGNVSDAVVAALLAGNLEAFAGNRMRLYTATQQHPGLRLLQDNFYAVEQSVIVAPGKAGRVELINRIIDEVRTSGLIADSIEDANLQGVDVAPPATRPQ
jgi:polar amino acid transport system substrate-binding protein